VIAFKTRTTCSTADRGRRCHASPGRTPGTLTTRARPARTRQATRLPRPGPPQNRQHKTRAAQNRAAQNRQPESGSTESASHNRQHGTGITGRITGGPIRTLRIYFTIPAKPALINPGEFSQADSEVAPAGGVRGRRVRYLVVPLRARGRSAEPSPGPESAELGQPSSGGRTIHLLARFTAPSAVRRQGLQPAPIRAMAATITATA